MATKMPGKAGLTSYDWEGRDRAGRTVRGRMRAPDLQQVQAVLRRRGIAPGKIGKRQARGGGRRISPRDIALFTRQLSTMLKAGLPLLQAFDIVAHGHAHARVARLLGAIRAELETGSSLSSAFRQHPRHFNALYCSLVEAGEAAGILDELLGRLATYLEKIEGIKSRIRSALMYPVAVLLVASGVMAAIMLFVVPAFKQVFSSFGADLPAPTLALIAISEFCVDWGGLVLGGLVLGSCLLARAWRRSARVQAAMDRLLLRLPVLGRLLRHSIVARWSRTLATLFAAGVPLVEALDSVAGAAGSSLYAQATGQIQQDVANGASLTASMARTGLFPPMVLQMALIGEESGSLDQMLGKAADVHEAEVDDLVAGLSNLMEPLIIVVLGVLIGGVVVAMYLPIFKLGQVV